MLTKEEWKETCRKVGRWCEPEWGMQYDTKEELENYLKDDNGWWEVIDDNVPRKGENQ